MASSGQIMQNVSKYGILQYVLQYGSAVLQYCNMVILFLPYCFTTYENIQLKTNLLLENLKQKKVNFQVFF